MAIPAGADWAVPYDDVSCGDAAGTRRRRPQLNCATARFEEAVPIRPLSAITLSCPVALTGVGITSHRSGITAFSARRAALY